MNYFLSRTGVVKYSRRYHCHYSEIEVVLGKRSVKLFLCKRGKKEAWKVLQLFFPILESPDCPPVRNTIPQAMMSTTTVRTAVARLELTPSIPTLAKMDVRAANTEESTAKNSHILIRLDSLDFPELSFIIFLFLPLSIITVPPSTFLRLISMDNPLSLC